MRDSGDTYRAACAALARAHDHERYLACLFAPAVRRDALFAVLAANHEIAKTAEVVSDPTIGQIRLQWWRETVDGVEAGMPRAHEVAEPLAAAVVGNGLRLERLRTVIEAREADLAGEPPATLDDLERYAAATGGEIHAALAEVLGAPPAPWHAAGTAWALIGLARAVPALVAAGRAPIPEALLQETGISHQKIADIGRSLSIGAAIRPIVERARYLLRSAGESSDYRASAGRPLRLLADRAGDLAREFEGVAFEPFALRPAAPGLVWRYAFRALRYRLGL